MSVLYGREDTQRVVDTGARVQPAVSKWASGRVEVRLTNLDGLGAPLLAPFLTVVIDRFTSGCDQRIMEQSLCHLSGSVGHVD